MSFLLERNQRVRMLGDSWVFRRKVTDDCWQLENLGNGRIVERTRKELLVLWEKKELSPIFESDDRPTKLTTLQIPVPAEQLVKLRLKYVKAVEGLPVTKSVYEDVLKEVWEALQKEAETIVPRGSPYAEKLKKKWDWTTVYRWVTRYTRLNRDEHALLHKKRVRHLNLPGRLLEILEDAIDEIYLTRERKTLRDTLDHAKVKVSEENEEREKLGKKLLPVPGLRILNRVRSTIKAFDQYAARYGRQAAIVKYRSVKKHVITTAPLERVEIDHTPLDLFVVDDETGLPLGRPYLTVCIDDHTRCILGLYISFAPPSFVSIAQCLNKAFRRKDWLKEEYPEVENVPEIYGKPLLIVVDQALEFHAHDFVRACGRLGIAVQYSARKTPWNKGKVERVVRTINDEIAHGVPGTTFSNIIEKGDYNPEKYAAVTLSTLKKAIHIWVYDVYHQREHRALAMSPADMWAKTINYDNISMPDDPDALDVILGKQRDRVLTHKGVESEGLFYNSEDMEALSKQYGARLEVKISVDESNIGSLHVLYKEHVFKVPALRNDYAEGISLWQHKKFKASAETKSCDGWLKAKERIRKIFEAEFLLRRKRAKNLARLLDGIKDSEPAPNDVNQMRPKCLTETTDVPHSAMPLAKTVPKYAPILQTRAPKQEQAIHSKLQASIN